MSDKLRLLPKEQAISLLQVLEALYRNAPFAPPELTLYIKRIYQYCKGNIFIGHTYSGTLTALEEICIGGVQEFESVTNNTPARLIGVMFNPECNPSTYWQYIADFLQETTYLKNAFFPLASIEELHPGMVFVQIKRNSKIDLMKAEIMNSTYWDRGFVQVARIETAYQLERRITIALAHSVQTELFPLYQAFHKLFMTSNSTIDEIRDNEARFYEPESETLSNESVEKISREIIRQEQYSMFRYIIADLDELAPVSPSRQQQILTTYSHELPQKHLNFIQEHMYLSAYIKMNKAILYLHSKGKDKVNPSNTEISQAYVNKVIQEYESQQAQKPAPAQQPAQEQGQVELPKAAVIAMYEAALKDYRPNRDNDALPKHIQLLLDAIQGIADKKQSRYYSNLKNAKEKYLPRFRALPENNHLPDLPNPD